MGRKVGSCMVPKVFCVACVALAASRLLTQPALSPWTRGISTLLSKWYTAVHRHASSDAVSLSFSLAQGQDPGRVEGVDKPRQKPSLSRVRTLRVAAGRVPHLPMAASSACALCAALCSPAWTAPTLALL